MYEETAADWVEDVKAAAGSPAGFARLVKRFEGAAFGQACAWLGDRWLAEDVTQEAFIEVYLHLHELRDPRAFPAWLRRIVAKHCDRVTRRARLPVMRLEEEAWADTLAAADVASGEAPGSDLIAARIEALPAPQWQALALSYLAGLDQGTVAALLGIPRTAVKARLRRARERLRRDLMTGPSISVETGGRPPSRTARLFAALRAGDARTVNELVEADASLAQAEEDWPDSEALRLRLGFAQHGTPLIRAIERDELDVVDVLLEAGADPSQVCGCAAGEPPLFTAAVHGRWRHVERLLAAGADPHVTVFRGTTALHVAAMRGDHQLAEALLRGGARPLPDADGRTPSDWAAINGHEEVARLLGAGTAEKPSRGERGNIGETGIKAIDLVAPFRPGGMVRIVSRPGVGVSVLLAEVSARWVRHQRGRAYWTGFTQRPTDGGDVGHLLAESGVAGEIEVALVPHGLEPEERRAQLRRGIEREMEGPKPLLLIVFEETGLLADTESVYDLLAHEDVLALVVSPLADADDKPAGRPFTGGIWFSSELAKRGCFPRLTYSGRSRTRNGPRSPSGPSGRWQGRSRTSGSNSRRTSRNRSSRRNRLPAGSGHGSRRRPLRQM